MFDKCPGVSTILQPTIKFKTCPECGAQVEMVSTDMKANCDKCGFTIYNDVISCVQWCEYAKDCVGEEVYERLKGAKNEADELKLRKEVMQNGQSDNRNK